MVDIDYYLNDTQLIINYLEKEAENSDNKISTTMEKSSSTSFYSGKFLYIIAMAFKLLCSKCPGIPIFNK